MKSIDQHMKSIASAVSKSQGGTTGASCKTDKNRGSDKGGSNAPSKKNAK